MTACPVCESLEMIQECGIQTVYDSLKDERDKVIKQGFATYEDLNGIYAFVRAGQHYVQHTICGHQNTQLLKRTIDIPGGSIPVQDYSALFSDFDFISETARLNAY